MSVTITGIIVFLLAKVIPLEQASQFVDTAIQLIGIALAWYGRYRIGDITWYGTRK